MARRKKDPPPPKSGAWESYRPDDDLYWRLGGPFVPIEKIPPSEYNYHRMATHLKPPGRIRYLRDLVRMAEADMDREKEAYLRYEEKGIDGLTHQWHRDEDRKLEAEGHWCNVARNIDRQRASAYRSIRMNLNKLASYKAQLAEAESLTIPLLAGLDD